MSRAIGSIFVLILMATLLVAEGENGPYISVNGNGEVRVVPDEAVIRAGVTRQEDTAQAAQQGVNEAVQNILKSLRTAGIEESQIQTSQLTLYPVYAPPKPEYRSEPQIVGYRAVNSISVRTQKLSQVGSIIDEALGAGANQLENISFGLRNDIAAREQALKGAIVEARRKAQVMAEALAVKLGPILEVTEGGVSYQRPVYAAATELRAAGPAATPVSPGEVQVTASVAIRYRIVEDK